MCGHYSSVTIAHLLVILSSHQTCKPFRALVIASRAVQYRIQLGRCGMIEGNSVSTLQKSSEERSKLLHETIGRRRTFEPVFIHDLGMTEANHDRAFDLLDGIYVRLTHEPVETSAPDGEAVARLIIKDLSGDCRRPAQVTQLDVFPTDISIAPSLDLIVLLVVEHEALQEPFLRLHMRTLSSGGLQDHSDAQKPVLRFPHKFLMPALLEPEFHISIDKDVLALYVAESAVEVFRWTTGRHILVSLELLGVYHHHTHLFSELGLCNQAKRHTRWLLVDITHLLCDWSLCRTLCRLHRGLSSSEQQ